MVLRWVTCKSEIRRSSSLVVDFFSLCRSVLSRLGLLCATNWKMNVARMWTRHCDPWVVGCWAPLCLVKKKLSRSRRLVSISRLVWGPIERTSLTGFLQVNFVCEGLEPTVTPQSGRHLCMSLDSSKRSTHIQSHRQTHRQTRRQKQSS